ncbi:MAG: hypothetical protein IJX88_06340 [Clostridia bacterium]|nr:hypothetical protein [Clostridia bacterium]
MEIDIIDYSDTQMATLSEEQILAVREAQLQKNRLERSLQEKFAKEKQRLVSGGTFLSEIWELYCAELQQAHDEEVANIRDGLLFYLRFAQKSESTTDKYTVDYSLKMEERYAIVKQYYDKTYADPMERYKAFIADEVAKAYMGEYYPVYLSELMYLAGVEETP